MSDLAALLTHEVPSGSIHGCQKAMTVAVWPKTQRTRVTIGVSFLFIPSCASGKVPLRTPSALPDSSVTMTVSSLQVSMYLLWSGSTSEL